MIDLSWYKMKCAFGKNEGEERWYVRPVHETTLTIKDIAQHMEAHNTPFTAGTIEGILTDFTKCIHEMLLEGKTVKIDNLGIFKISLQSNNFPRIGNIDTKTGKIRVQARIGSASDSYDMSAAVKSVKLLTTATGDLMTDKLNQLVRFDWSTEARAEMEAERNKVTGSTDTDQEVTGTQTQK